MFKCLSFQVCMCVFVYSWLDCVSAFLYFCISPVSCIWHQQGPVCVCRLILVGLIPARRDPIWGTDFRHLTDTHPTKQTERHKDTHSTTQTQRHIRHHTHTHTHTHIHSRHRVVELVLHKLGQRFSHIKSQGKICLNTYWLGSQVQECSFLMVTVQIKKKAVYKSCKNDSLYNRSWILCQISAGLN